MRRLTSRKVLAGAVGVTLAGAGIALAPLALAKPAPHTAANTDMSSALESDDLPNPLEEARRAAREEAIAGVLTGKYTAYKQGSSLVVDLGPESGDTSSADGHRRGGPGNGKGHGNGGNNHGHGHGHGKGHEDGYHGDNHKPRYVELSREATDQIFVVLVEFGDQANPYGDAPDSTRSEGPLHNQIPEPDRSVNNSTVWRSDFSQPFFQDQYFGGGESLKSYFETQSSGRYSVNGQVTNWVKVPYTEGRYGTDLCGSHVCSTVLALVRDGANAWVADQLAAGQTMAQVQADLAQFDVWDRYDIDGDGNFNEPDGFMDHFQIVHAGGDQADGDPIYGSDAIWSHRSYSNLAYAPSCYDANLVCITGTPIGVPNPAAANGGIVGGELFDENGDPAEPGDGNYTGLWIGDYTMQPENGGRSVFYHEYAHDLGLPDDYNIIGGGDNNNEYWTLMAQSRLGAASDEGIGERGGDLGAWNKLQLGWLNYQVVGSNQHKTLQLGPQEYNNSKPQAVVVPLPDQEIATELGEPYAGENQWYSGHTNDSPASLTRTVEVPAGGANLTFKTRYDIETDWDAAYVAVDGVPVVGTINGVATNLPNNQNSIPIGWDGTSDGWVDGVFPLPAGTHEVSINYFVDAYVGGNTDAPDGVFLDDIAVDGVFTDDAESGTGDWTAVNFQIFGSTTPPVTYEHFYIGGWRSYTSYDKYLKTGPYYFGYAPAMPDKVDHFSYEEGLLISYWNTYYDDNDTMVHPGHGRNLYIDAHPQIFKQSDDTIWRARVQVYDAPFGTTKTRKVTLHQGGVAQHFGGLPGVSTFDDTHTYWFAELPNHGVILPAVGVKIRVLNTSSGSMSIKVN